MGGIVRKAKSKQRNTPRASSSAKLEKKPKQRPQPAPAQRSRPAAAQPPNPKEPERELSGDDLPESVERLYYLGAGQYIQYDGTGKMPEALQRYLQAHPNTHASYIPLPMKPVEFCFSDWGERWGRARWEGHGPLPERVLEYVCENGVLPRYESA